MTLTISPFLADNVLLFLAMCIVWEVLKWGMWKVIEIIGAIYCDFADRREDAKGDA